MENMLFSYFGEVQDRLSSTDHIGFESMKGCNIGKQFNYSRVEDWEESARATDYSLYSDYGFCQDVISSQEEILFAKYQQQQQQSYSGYGLFDNLRFNIASPPIQTCLEETAKLDEIPTEIQDVVEPKRDKQFPISLASLELLKNYGNGFKRLNSERRIEPSIDITDTTFTKVATRKLSTEEIMRVAGERFIRSSSRAVEDVMSMLGNPFNLSFSGLSVEEIRDVELAEFLLAAAEKIGDQQYERATRLLNQCDCLSSMNGNPVQRVVYYFSEALRLKIDRETGRISAKDLEARQSFDLRLEMMSVNPTTLACHEALPFSQIIQFTGIQAMVENFAKSKRIHVIDLDIRNGMQWTVLMQALTSRYEFPVELLKITAVGTTAKHLIEETGQRLMNFAHGMSLPFAFNIVMVSDMLDLKEELLEIDAEETVAVYSFLSLRTMIPVPNRLENTMRVIRNINPSIMVVIEVDANHNSPVFVNRFIEALFYFSAFFDCFDACMERDNRHRFTTESKFFGDGINSIVAFEGEQRKTRSVKLDVWRAFFARYGMEEIELSSACLYQANLLAKNFACGSSCTIDMNGKTLLAGWKGTPLLSVSAWKFI